MSDGVTATLPDGVVLAFPVTMSPADVRIYLDGLMSGAPAKLAGDHGADRPPSSPFMTVKEAAAYLRVPPKRVYNLTSRREIPHIKQDGRIFFDCRELDEWMRAQKVESC